MTNFDKTDIFQTEEYRREYVKIILTDVVEAISGKGYDPVNQIIGYVKN